MNWGIGFKMMIKRPRAFRGLIAVGVMTAMATSIGVGANTLWAQTVVDTSILDTEVEPKKQFPVDYETSQRFTSHHRLSVTKRLSQLQSSDLRPERMRFERPFFYRYRLLEQTAFDSLPLSLQYQREYLDRHVGAGWVLAYTMTWETQFDLDILSPQLTFSGKDQGRLRVGGNQIWIERDVAQQQGRQPEDAESGLWKSEETPEGERYFFSRISLAGKSRLVPHGIEYKSGERVRFHYQVVNEKPLLSSLDTNHGQLRFFYDEAHNLGLEEIRLTKVALASDQATITWKFGYDLADNQEPALMHKIDIVSGDDVQQLNFSYGRFENRLRPSVDEVDWCDAELPGSSVWEAQLATQNGGRWTLPDVDSTPLSIKSDPGLRFMLLDSQDVDLDLISTESNKQRSWRWVEARQEWVEFTDHYKPEKPSIRDGRPSGSQYVSLTKKYKNKLHNTTGFQSILTSSYRPNDQRTALDYTRNICFPPIDTGEPDPSREWDCEAFDASDLIPPLQYEGPRGAAPWPEHIAGVQGRESFRNQGAQLVQLTGDGHLNILYMGLRYVDIETGEEVIGLRDHVLHRDTKNCRPFSKETWSNQGVTQVRVDLCQSFWWAKDIVWEEGQQGSFWLRLDMDGETPNESYILPWHDDNPDFYRHYRNFEHVRFAQLAPEEMFVVVSAGGKDDPDNQAIYWLRSQELGEWVEIEETSKIHPGLYFPKEIWQSKSMQFANIGGGTADDVISGFGTVYINMESQPGPRWKRCPAFDLPSSCNLLKGNCMVMTLENNNQGYADLFLSDGQKIFLNRAGKSTLVKDYVMTSFTDENGNTQNIVR